MPTDMATLYGQAYKNNPHRDRAAVLSGAINNQPQDRFGYSSIAKIPMMYALGGELGKSADFENSRSDALIGIAEQQGEREAKTEKSKMWFETLKVTFDKSPKIAVQMWNDPERGAEAYLGTKLKITDIDLGNRMTSVKSENGRWMGLDSADGKVKAWNGKEWTELSQEEITAIGNETRKAPEVKDFQEGSSVVSKQYDATTKKWVPVEGAKGPKFAPQVTQIGGKNDTVQSAFVSQGEKPEMLGDPTSKFAPKDTSLQANKTEDDFRNRTTHLDSLYVALSTGVDPYTKEPIKDIDIIKNRIFEAENYLKNNYPEKLQQTKFGPSDISKAAISPDRTISPKAEYSKPQTKTGVPPTVKPPVQVAPQVKTMNTMPPATAHIGKTIKDTTTNKFYKSDGKNWIEVK